MKHILKKGFYLTFAITILISSSCTQDNLEEQELDTLLTKPHLKITPIVEKILERGYDLKSIKEIPDYYVLEGDLLFPKDLERYPETNNNTQARHYQAGTLVSDQNATNILVFSQIIDPLGIPQGTSWTLAIQNAINQWNSITPCLQFILTPNENDADITIFDGDVNNSWPIGGAGIFGWVNGNPSCGQPFPNVLINTNFTYSNGNQPNQINMQNIIAHELGHAIGLRHTDGVEGSQIPGTQISDPNSIMHGNIINKTNTNFTNDDILATNYLYGCNSVINDNQNNSASVSIKNISPNPFCYTDLFNVSGTYSSTCSNNLVTIELCFQKIGIFGLLNCGIISGSFSNGGFSFSNLDLNDIPNFDPSFDYNISAKIIENGDIIASSSSVEIPFITDCNNECVNPCDLNPSFDYVHNGGSSYTFSPSASVTNNPCSSNYNYAWTIDSLFPTYNENLTINLLNGIHQVTFTVNYSTSGTSNCKEEISSFIYLNN
ncbi:M57 family metalloprotease [uncultured Olleya sp.]|uniref:M57 family metalloprotease n=1 Tax=uncultured Olleya sp. TaxID=757243 RepID=UPI00259A0189|nr:M57 family metalloprotease [uncultured Olleya sp.]